MSEPRHTNRLISETSPYLLQHAHNPVDWYAWGDEAFEKARRENKPIFLSVGYSTCHWCHVMERESFEQEDVAELLNAGFVPIKVDREERPDIDEQYMLATQLFTRRGGWPNSVWLTPDGRPWFAGTYFPREDRGGMPGFKTVLRSLSDAWQNRQDEVQKQAESFVEAIEQVGQGEEKQRQPLSQEIVHHSVDYFLRAHDEQYGGLRGSPKFPPHGVLALLLNQARHDEQNTAVTDMVTHTLDGMASGGMYDHIGGGFHRYATDARWFLPHFEKMLYDNAQLVAAYAQADDLTERDEYGETVAQTFDWLKREMTDPAGGFYSAIDADSEGEEGKFYVWSVQEIHDLLDPEDAELFIRVYGLSEEGNFLEEATRQRTGTNVVHLARPLPDIAADLGEPEDQLRERLQAMRGTLLEARDRRPRPGLDDKVLSGWNGLMITALAQAGRMLHKAAYTEAASRAADFVLQHMRRDGRLLRSWRKGEARLPAYLDDYAFVIEGLLALHETTRETRWLDEARRLAETMIELFHDPRDGGFFSASTEHDALLIRAKELGGGGNMPSGNGAAASALIRLAVIDDNRRLAEIAVGTLRFFANTMQANPHGSERLVLATAELYQAAQTSPAITAALTGDEPSNADAIVDQPPLHVEAFSQQRSVRPGQRLVIAVRLAVQDGYHIYGPDVPPEKLRPTQVTLEDGPAQLIEVRYPEPRQTTDPVLNEQVSTYDGTVLFSVAIDIDAAASPGETSVLLTLVAQPCDDRACLEPQHCRLSVPLTITPEASGESRHGDIFRQLT